MKVLTTLVITLISFVSVHAQTLDKIKEYVQKQEKIESIEGIDYAEKVFYKDHESNFFLVSNIITKIYNTGRISFEIIEYNADGSVTTSYYYVDDELFLFEQSYQRYQYNKEDDSIGVISKNIVLHDFDGGGIPEEIKKDGEKVANFVLKMLHS